MKRQILPHTVEELMRRVAMAHPDRTDLRRELTEAELMIGYGADPCDLDCPRASDFHWRWMTRREGHRGRPTAASR